MIITIVITINIVFGFLICQTWNYSKVIKKTNEINQFPIWAKGTIIFINLLCLFSLILQIVAFINREQKMAMSMLFLACVLQFISGNLLKPREGDEQ